MRRDANSSGARLLMQPFGRLSAGLASAGADLWCRSLEISARRFGAAMSRAVSAGAPRSDLSSWMEAMLNEYRQYMAEMALTVPIAAQRFQREVATAVGGRLLFCATRAAEAGGPSLPSLPLQPGDREGGKLVDLSPELLDGLRKILSDGGIQDWQVPMLLKDAADDLAGKGMDVSGVREALDDLGRAVGHKQIDQIAGIWAEVNRKLAGGRADAPGSLAVIAKLRQALGETASHSLLNREVIDQLTRAMPADAQYLRVDSVLHRQMQIVFKEFGIDLSQSVSVVRAFRDWLISDHERDRVYRVVRAGDRLEVYGEEEGRSYQIGNTSLLLPARVHDAAQGFAAYWASKAAVQDLLNLQPGRMLQAVEMGSKRTPVVVFVVDYRESDLKSYRELGIACWVAPKDDPLAMGMHVLQLPVDEDGDLSCRAGRTIWGYPKGLYRIRFTYSDDSLACLLSTRGDSRELLTLTLPRGGCNSTRSIPTYSYTVKRGWLYRTVFTRSGRGESIRRGGAGVRLEAHSKSPDPVLDTLRYLGVLDETPFLSTWTEHMSGEFGPAVALAAPQDD